MEIAAEDPAKGDNRQGDISSRSNPEADTTDGMIRALGESALVGVPSLPVVRRHKKSRSLDSRFSPESAKFIPASSIQPPELGVSLVGMELDTCGSNKKASPKLVLGLSKISRRREISALSHALVLGGG